MDLAGAPLVALLLSPIAIPNILNQVSSQGFDLHKTHYHYRYHHHHHHYAIGPSPGFRPDFHYKL